MAGIIRVVFSFAVVFAAVGLVSLFISPGVTAWYDGLIKPGFTPPDWLFALLWLTLYVLLAIALARVWNAKETKGKRMWFFTFAIQLLLTILWAILFFDIHAVSLSIVGIIILWFAVIVLTMNSYEVERSSFWLLVPYLAWVTFVMILNIAIWWQN